jgi:hypothetical protein
MPTLIACPRCQRKLRVPDDLVGKNVKCPGCEQPFTADAGTDVTLALPPRTAAEQRVSVLPLASPQPDEETAAEEEATRPQRSVPPANWRRVRRGFSFLLASALAYIGAVLLYLGSSTCLALAIFSTPRMAPGGAAPPGAAQLQKVEAGFLVIMGMFLLALLTAFVLWVVGHIFSLAAPRAHGARKLAWVTVSLVLTSLVLLLAYIGLAVLTGNFSDFLANFDIMDGDQTPYPPGLEIIADIVGYVCFGLMAVSMFTFGFYVRAVSLCLGAASLRRSVKGWLITLGVTTILGLLTGGAMYYVFQGALDTPAGPVGAGVLVSGGLGCLFGIVALALGIWYIILLAQARTAISARASLRF